jgi:hypothetical protein
MQPQLTDADMAVYTKMEEAARIRITREIKIKTQAFTFNLISGFHPIARFKAEIRAGLMRKKGQLATLALIKNEAVQIELILEEKTRKSFIGTNGTNCNGIKPAFINQIQKDNQNQVEAIKGNNYNPY